MTKIDHDAIAAHARRCPATDPDAAGAAAYLDLYDEVQRLRAALEWYANPQVYAASKHGIAFDSRDKSYVAREALKGDSDE